MNRWINRLAALALVGIVLMVAAAPAAAQAAPGPPTLLRWGSEAS
jgi:hypothetical protein